MNGHVYMVQKEDIQKVALKVLEANVPSFSIANDMGGTGTFLVELPRSMKTKDMRALVGKRAVYHTQAAESSTPIVDLANSGVV